MRKKISFIFIIFISLFALLGISLFRWQVLDSDKWKALAEESRQFTQTIVNQRGIIKARDGRILASNEVVYKINIDKKNIVNASDFMPRLAAILGISPDVYQTPMNDNDVKYFPLPNKYSQEKRDNAVLLDCKMNSVILRKIFTEDRADFCKNVSLAATRTAGINIEQTTERVYPNGSLAAHVLGFMGLDENGKEIGSNGVEGYYDKYLTGKSGLIQGIRDQAGNVILRDDLKTDAGQEGTYLELTIDIGIQRIVEDKLKAGVEAKHAKGGTAIVMDPASGEILAFANYPTYDPSKYFDGQIIDCTQYLYKNYANCESQWGDKEKAAHPDWDKKTQQEKDAIKEQERSIPAIFTNQGLSEVREPGSIMKVVTVSGAINEGLVNANTVVPDHAGCIMVADKKICTADFVGAKGQTVDKMLEKSDNIGALYVGQKLGADNLYKYLDAFGIGREVRVGLDGESIYPLAPADTWNVVDTATSSFGQGKVSTNSMENISALSTIANGGKRMQPHIIKQFVSGDKEKNFDPQVISTPVTESTAKQVKDMLERGTREGYTAPSLHDILKNYTMAGKTGTAQIPDGKGGYVLNAYNNTYVGFAPANNPKFIMLITMREPEGGTYAGFTAVPVWSNIAKEILPYMGVIPDKK